MWQVFPKGHTSVSFPSGQSVLRLSFTVGFRWVYAAFCFPLFFRSSRQTASRARVKGEKWEAVGFPQGKSLNFHQLTASRFLLIVGKRFGETLFHFLFDLVPPLRSGSTTLSACLSGTVPAALPPSSRSRRRRRCRIGPQRFLAAPGSRFLEVTPYTGPASGSISG